MKAAQVESKHPFDGQLQDYVGDVIFTPGTTPRPNFTSFDVRLLPSVNLRPSQPVAALVRNEEEQVLVIGRVTSASESNPHETVESAVARGELGLGRGYAAEGKGSTVIYRVANIDVLEQAEMIDEKLQIAAPNTLTRAGCPVFTLGQDLMSDAIGLCRDEESGLYIGTVPGTGLKVVIKPDILQRHLLIVGGTGSGKSYSVGVINEESAAFGIPSVGVDSQNEMVESTEQLAGGRNLKPGVDIKLPLSAFTAGDIIRAVDGLTDNQQTLLARTFINLVDESEGRPFSLSNLLDRMAGTAEGLQMKGQTLSMTIGRTKGALGELTFIGDKPMNWKDLIKPGVHLNVPCKNLSLEKLRMFVAALARDLQRLRITDDESERIPPVRLVLDEAHLLMPEREDTTCKQVLREWIRIGRHYGLMATIITQSPIDIDKAVIRQCQTRMIFSLERDQLNSLSGVFADATEEQINTLPKMPQGTALLTGSFETVRHAIQVKVRARVTTHGGAAPNIFDELKAGGWKKDGKASLNDVLRS